MASPNFRMKSARKRTEALKKDPEALAKAQATAKRQASIEAYHQFDRSVALYLARNDKRSMQNLVRSSKVDMAMLPIPAQRMLGVAKPAQPITLVLPGRPTLAELETEPVEPEIKDE